MRVRSIIGLVLVFGMLTGVAAVASGAETPESKEDAIGRTPPRLSFTKGEVSFWRPGAQEWSQAQINTPLAPGDELYTGSQRESGAPDRLPRFRARGGKHPTRPGEPGTGFSPDQGDRGYCIL